MLQELEANLTTQSEEVTGFAEQQREAAERSLEAARGVTQEVMTSLSAMEGDAAKFREHVNTSSEKHDQGLLELAEAYEVCLLSHPAAN